MPLVELELTEEFPAEAGAIVAMRASSTHFAHLTNRYQELNHTILRMETNVEPADDFTMEEFKKERLRIKDEIVALLKS